MSDMNLIRGKLTKLISASSQVECGWRRISDSTAAQQVAAVIEELDETLFPRRLTLRNGDGMTLCLEAANRRLRRFLPPAPDPLCGFSDFFDKGSLRADDDSAGQVVGLLTRFLSGTSSVMVHSSDLPDLDAIARTGISASDLSKAHASTVVSHEPAAIAEAVTAIVDELICLCDAWTRMEGDEVVAASKPGIDPAILDELLDADWWRTLDDPAAARCIAIGKSGASGTEIVVVGQGTEVFIASEVRLDSDKINELWRAATCIPN